jgi:hypothetical protein
MNARVVDVRVLMWIVSAHVGTCVFGLQVPMVGKGVVDALVATLAAVQGEGAQALPVQEAACWTLHNLSAAAGNWVRLCAGVVPVAGDMW